MKAKQMVFLAMTGVAIMFVIFAIASINKPVEESIPTEVRYREDIRDLEYLQRFEFSGELKKASSIEELKLFLSNIRSASSIGITIQYSGSLREGGADAPLYMGGRGETIRESLSYSRTNVQVLGVDEPDFVKNDDKYIYILSGNKITIVEAYPPEDAKIVVKIGIDVRNNLENMFLNRDRLVIFYNDYQEEYYIPKYDYIPTRINIPNMHVLILDVSDKENPKKVKDYSIDGYYYNARMINDTIYIITKRNIFDYNIPIIPSIRDEDNIIEPEIFYSDTLTYNPNFSTLVALDIFDNEINAQTYVIDDAGTIYASDKNIYITYPKYIDFEENKEYIFFNIILPLLPKDVNDKILEIESSSISEDEKWDKISDILEEMYNKMSDSDKSSLFSKIDNAIRDYEIEVIPNMKTVIYKISIDGLNINYSSKAEVPGYLLNQFSMDEYNNRFRVATTIDTFIDERVMYNNVYVFDEDMNIVGKLEDIARDERIYAARFMADKLYLVTFREMDPFFVIDLSDDTPKILGALKIPGFSNYLHPYDENHIIGIGRDTILDKDRIVSVKGIKIALFDITDVTNPKVTSAIVIGDEYAESEALYEHKAVLFDKEKGILSIPIYLNSYQYEGDITRVEHWQGFYVFNIDLNGIELKGKIEHNGDFNMNRSLYIDNILYTISSSNVKINDSNDIHEIKTINLFSNDILKYID